MEHLIKDIHIIMCIFGIKKGSIIGQTADSKYVLDEKDKFFDSTNAELQHKLIATRKTSNSTNYFNKNNFDSYDVLPSVFDSTESNN